MLLRFRKDYIEGHGIITKATSPGKNIQGPRVRFAVGQVSHALEIDFFRKVSRRRWLVALSFATMEPKGLSFST
jgi:hypothetical protein